MLVHLWVFSRGFLQWKEAKPEELMDSKLRCVFEMPVENEKTVSICTFALLCRFLVQI